MEQVKIFQTSEYSNIDDIEGHINIWFKENPNIKVIERFQTQLLLHPVEYKALTTVTITIFYTEG